MARDDVVIAGGGVAGLEAALALRDLVGAALPLTLVAPEPDFVYRPMTVAEPFGYGDALRLPLRRFAADVGAELVFDAVTAVDAREHRVRLSDGDALAYESLIVAVGAQIVPPFADAITFGSPGSTRALRTVVDDLTRGAIGRVAFIAPTLTGWTLPIYELAVMTARAARSSGRGTAELYLLTPEQQPLEVFGPVAAADVADRLEHLGVEFLGGTYADVSGGVVVPREGDRVLEVDAVVTLPLLRGPQIPGLPAESDQGFITVDVHGRVTGLADVYAAGDATNFPIKQGGLATQQADAVAHHLASRRIVDHEPQPFRPILRGMLFTGGESYFRIGTGEHAPAGSAERPLWWPPTKIAGRYLTPYIARVAGAGVDEPTPSGFTKLSVPVGQLRLRPEPYDPVGPGVSTVA